MAPRPDEVVEAIERILAHVALQILDDQLEGVGVPLVAAADEDVMLLDDEITVVHEQDTQRETALGSTHIRRPQQF